MINPDKKKYKLVKRNKKGIVAVDNQILLWRKHRKHKMQPVEKYRTRFLREAKEKKEEQALETAFDLFGIKE